MGTDNHRPAARSMLQVHHIALFRYAGVDNPYVHRADLKSIIGHVRKTNDFIISKATNVLCSRKALFQPSTSSLLRIHS